LRILIEGRTTLYGHIWLQHTFILTQSDCYCLMRADNLTRAPSRWIWKLVFNFSKNVDFSKSQLGQKWEIRRELLPESEEERLQQQDRP